MKPRRMPEEKVGFSSSDKIIGKDLHRKIVIGLRVGEKNTESKIFAEDFPPEKSKRR